MSTFVERINQADLWLLDRVFQPVSDRLPEKLPSAELGMSLQLGAIVFFLAAIVILSISGYASIGDSVFNILNWVLFVAFYLAIMRMRGLVKPGQANPLRSMLFGMRPLNVGFLIYSLWVGVTGNGALMLASLFMIVSNMIFTMGLYFVSCQPRPPVRRRSQSRVELRPIMGGLRD
ncbi:hypothetical protein [Asaia spathodeae]|uniref:Uncharacterized protein n=1 Tax=Asaia spathodeae TaxID=657016 RepID=A0ABX2P3P0_9PROT|nr:hypothetical protein [Asaia spathodeae]GBR22100.1 hypothetical protein AA105894_2969 [Asaia spathodeae NBRC 105894]